MKAIVDCNSFYCSCERVFRPELKDKPVAVLSNNDGCIISLSDEAKRVGIKMTNPYFIAKPLIDKHTVTIFSSNYNLYGDMSWRVMETLRKMLGEENVEVYSVDEAFLNMDGFSQSELKNVAADLKYTVEKWTGVHVSVGAAPTKTLAKLANHLAKKNKAATECVMILDTQEKIIPALQQTNVKELWGIGRQQANKLTSIGINTAWDLRNMPEEWARKNLGGVVGVRLIKELNGEEAIVMNEELTSKKMISTSRMFGDPVTELVDIKEAIATYTTRAAEKLRRQQSAANMIGIYIVPKEKTEAPHFHHGPTVSAYSVLPHSTALTNDLIKPALQMAERIYVKDKLYKKAGVILSGLVPDTSIQANLFEPPAKSMGRFLMEIMDNINFSMRDDMVKFAASGTKRNWKMRQDFHSPRYTTRWKELYAVS